MLFTRLSPSTRQRPPQAARLAPPVADWLAPDAPTWEWPPESWAMLCAKRRRHTAKTFLFALRYGSNVRTARGRVSRRQARRAAKAWA